MPSEFVHDIEGILSNKVDREDDLRAIFFHARNHVQREISEQLADFRGKRSLGKLAVFVYDLVIFACSCEDAVTWKIKCCLVFMHPPHVTLPEACFCPVCLTVQPMCNKTLLKRI